MGRLFNTVLCMDDQWLRLMARKQHLEANGYKVIETTNGDEALKLFRTSSIDAVVLAYLTPGMKGHVVAARMKRVKTHVPILLLSTYGPLPDKKLQSVDAFLLISQEAKYLVSTVRQLMANRSKPFFHRWFDHWTGRNQGIRP